MSIIVKSMEKDERKEPAKADVDGLGLKSRHRHYTNLGRTDGRLQLVPTNFRWDRFDALLGLRAA
jgi:hypothetical protein